MKHTFITPSLKNTFKKIPTPNTFIIEHKISLRICIRTMFRFAPQHLFFLIFSISMELVVTTQQIHSQ